MPMEFCLTMLGAALAASRPIALDHGSIEVDMTGAVVAPTAPAETIPVDGPWRLVQTLDGVRTWEAPLPARTRTLFFHRPPKGMELVQRRDGDDSWSRARRVNHRPMGSPAPNSWSFDSNALHIRRAVDAGPPPSGAYGMRFPEAREREQALRATASSTSSFAVRSLQVGDTTHHGLFLVPGMLLRTTVEVPSHGELRFQALSVPPEAASPSVPRDGQQVSVTVVDDQGHREPLWTARPPDAVPMSARLDLSRWRGRTVQLEFSAPSDGVDDHDSVFLVDPVVLEPDPDPPRVVLIFVDTLRQDALSIYGNPRPTSPGIDHWAAEATVFTQARSVAPWTLPTARALFSGRAPELWGQTSDLPTILGQQGWATAFIAGNIYLSSNFDMANHWSTHRCINWPRAEVQLDRAEQWLANQHDRPALLVLHFMDMHLPYTEPESFRDRFAGPTPELFGSDVFHRNQIVDWERDMEQADREWVKARYHNNLAYIDSVLTPFLESLPSDATVVLVSDHGEEFWDHGEFEHGHSLYEELLRIPMIAKGPGFPPGTTNAPTSILDITPTILRAAGIDAELEGVPLQEVAAQPDAFADRALAFGRPLYGQRRWGVVQNDRKYTTWKSTETVVDLRADPTEAHNLLPEAADAARWRNLLSEALRTPVHIAWSLYPQRTSRAPDLTVRVQSPGGIHHAWAAEDPTLMSAVTTSVEDGIATLRWEGGRRGTREAYVVPNGDPLASLVDATIEIHADGTTGTLPLPSTAPVLDGNNHVVGRVRVGGRSVTLQATVVPLPPEKGIGITGYNKEVEAELEALGYLDH